MIVKKFKYRNWIDQLLSQGKNCFTLEDFSQNFEIKNLKTRKKIINRLIKSKQIVSVYKGFYIILTPEYRSKEMIPPFLFIDQLMKFLNREYYVGLLNAASIYGSAHYQPQEFFVITEYPKLRTTIKNGIKINYISKKSIPNLFIEKHKTQSGYINVSNPELTSVDLIQYEELIGGLNRAVNVILDLINDWKIENLNSQFIRSFKVSTIQRLGFLVDKIIMNKNISDILYNLSKSEKLRFQKIPLKYTNSIKDCEYDEKWKILINTKIILDS